MNKEMNKLEDSLPRNCCEFCTHLSLDGPNKNYTYDIKCITSFKVSLPKFFLR